MACGARNSGKAAPALVLVSVSLALAWLGASFCAPGAPSSVHSQRQLRGVASGTPAPPAASSTGTGLPCATALVVAAAAAGALVRSGSRTRPARGSAAARRATAKTQQASVLIDQNKVCIEKIKTLCPGLPEEYDDLKLLRFAVQHEGDAEKAAANVKEVMTWRAGEGKPIVEAAEKAIAQAVSGGGWDNAPVLAAAPHSAKINQFITSKQMLVVSTKGGDIVTCIQAATIDSDALMGAVTEQEMTEFFIYAREVNSRVADARTRKTGQFVRLIAANDLTGVSRLPNKDFQSALTGSAKTAVTLYPGYSGATVLLNLPWLARMLVSVLTPLFPGAVRDKIKFARGPMAYLEDLQDVLKEPTKSIFIDDLEAVLSS